jgi:hypothetical protein
MPTLVASYSDTEGASGANGNDLATTTFTPVNGEVLVVKLATWSQSATLGAPTGGSLTYTERVRYTPPGADCFIAIYTAVVSGSPINMSVASVHSGGDSAHSLVVERWNNANLAVTPVTIRVNATAAPSANFTTTGPNSVISLLCADYAGKTGTATYRGTSTQVLAFRVTDLFNSFNWYQTVATASTTAVGMTSPTAQQYQMTGIEIKGPSAVSQAIGLTSESNTAHALRRRKSRTLGLASETSTVHELGSQRVRALGLASETGSAQALRKSKTKGVGLASDVGSSHSLTRAKSHLLGVGGSTDSVSRLGRVKSLGTAGDTASAQVLGRGKSLGLGQVVGSETVSPLGRALGIVGESSTSPSLGRGKAKTLGPTGGVETALSVGRGKRLTLGLVGGTETALQVTGSKTRLLGLVSELATSHELAKAKTQTLGIVETTDRVLPLGGELGLATETSTVHSLRRTKRHVLGLASESTDVLTVGRAKQREFGITADSNSLESLIRTKAKSLGITGDSTGVKSWNTGKSKSLELLVSLDTALPMSGDAVHVDRSGPLTDSAALRMSTANRYRRR